VRSVEILQSAIGENLSSIHPRRVAAVWRAVTGLIVGGTASLTALGRSLPGETSEKHRIKAVDRLLGNKALHEEHDQVYRAIAHWLLKGVRIPAIAVDWTGAGAHHDELSAKLCSDGRALPLFSLVFVKGRYVQSNAHQEFLRRLSNILPAGCKPILITDAGFHNEWFAEVRRYNWHYIGRIRGRSFVKLAGRQLTLQQVHRLAGSQAKDLGMAILSVTQPHAHRLVLSAQPRAKGRKRLTRRGKPGRATTDHKASKGAREPWVLATSLVSDAASVVRAYGFRMQIEQSFRDRKCYRHGWSMRLAITRSPERLAVLHVIASLAELAVQIAGRAVAVTNVSLGFQANTTRKRRVLSYFFLGCRACRTGVMHTTSQLRGALKGLVHTIKCNARLFATELVVDAIVRSRPSALRGRGGTIF
jgi:hypothetical protein